jgi:hypothetical protein
MVSSSKTGKRPEMAQAMASNPTDVPFQPTPGGEPPAWNSILPTGNGPAQLSDPMRSEPSRDALAATASAPASTPPNSGAATSAASVPADVQNLPPEIQQQYMAAKAAGDDALAARILLAAKMMSPVQQNHDRGNGGLGSSRGGGGWRGEGGIAGGMGGFGGGLY